MKKSAIFELLTLYPNHYAITKEEKKLSHLSQHAISEYLKRFPSTKGTFPVFRNFFEVLKGNAFMYELFQTFCQHVVLQNFKKSFTYDRNKIFNSNFLHFFFEKFVKSRIVKVRNVFIHNSEDNSD